MSENHPDGFLKAPRAPIGKRPAESRRQDSRQIYAFSWDKRSVQEQGQRCMDCGVPTCMGGCPIGNRIPEWNDLVFRGRWKEALKRLHSTNNFPEFTGYTCPAPCEPACTLAFNDQPVTIKDIERAIIDEGWSQGWIQPEPPRRRTDKTVAVVGSGPAGLAAAQQLNRAGHLVTVFEKDEAPGGLMTFGIPDFKFEKHQVERRINQLAEEGIRFQCNVTIGADISIAELRERFDAVCLAIGATQHRDLSIPGRNMEGIAFGMDYLVLENRRARAGGGDNEWLHAKGKHVVVLGGGDTGADCVATAHRQGAASVTQVSIRDQAPAERPTDNPWPFQPKVYEQTYALEEGGSERYSLDTLAFLDQDGDGHVDALEAEKVKWRFDRQGRRIDKTVIERGIILPAELVLIAIGFTGPQVAPLNGGRKTSFPENSSIKVNENMMTHYDGVFAAGDCRLGASLVVWAIGEGRDVAGQIDRYLMGWSHLPKSIQTFNPVTESWKQ